MKSLRCLLATSAAVAVLVTDTVSAASSETFEYLNNPNVTKSLRSWGKLVDTSKGHFKGAGDQTVDYEGSEISEPLAQLFDFASRDLSITPLKTPSSTQSRRSDVVPALTANTSSVVPADASGSARNISRDGVTVVGFLDSGFFTYTHAFVWTESEGIIDLGTLVPADNENHSSFATDVSDDGSVVVGYSTLEGEDFPESAFRWTEASGMVALGSGLDSGGSSRAYAVSGDGSVVVGRSDFPPPAGSSFDVRQPFFWSEADGLVSLGGLETTSRGTARAVSADGSVVVGESTVSVMINGAQTGRDHAFRWTESGGMEDLGVLAGHEASSAIAVSDDGSVIVGISSPTVFAEFAGGTLSYDLENSRAFYWTEADGMRDLSELLESAGVELRQGALVGVTGMSGDGKWIMAVGSRPSAEFPEFIVDSFPVLVSLSETLAARSHLLNLSTRAQSLTGENVLIPGLVVEGSESKRLLIRAVGPALADFGVDDVLADPVMTLKRSVGDTSVDVAASDDWSASANAAEIATVTSQVGAFSLAEGSKDAALLLDVEPGLYTIVAAGKGGATGNAIVEVYDAEAGLEAARLVNLSTRGFVGQGDSIMISGFVVSNESSGRLLVRVVGPTLASFGVQGTLADPQLKLIRQESDGSSTEILVNDDWGTVGSAPGAVWAAEDVGAFPLNSGSKDAAVVVQLLPGAYTVQARGVGSATGTALIEVYELP